MPNAILFDILEAIRADIEALELSGLAVANVAIRKTPTDRMQDLPATRFPSVVIAPFGAESLDPKAGTNARDDVMYPVLVAILAADTGNPEERLNQYLGWRETIRRSFHNQRLSATLCFSVQVAPLEIVDRKAWLERQVFASGLILKCFSRESRG